MALAADRAPANRLDLERSVQALVYGRLGDLEVRLARTPDDVRVAQQLRYEVFYREMSATPSARAALLQRDADDYDAVCDHLLVFDTKAARGRHVAWSGRRAPRAVGTYRVLLQGAAARTLGFYTQREYDIGELIARHGADTSFMELGRSCVLAPYRDKRTVELLWQGLWTYVRERGVDVMFGCASFEGSDPGRHALALRYLHRHHLAPPEWRVAAHARHRVAMDPSHELGVDSKRAIAILPPLIKGYLRLGAWVGDGAVVDREFGTTDVLIVLPVFRIDPRYFRHFGAPDELERRGHHRSGPGRS